MTSIPFKMACPSSSSLPGNALKIAISVTMYNSPYFFISYHARQDNIRITRFAILPNRFGTWFEVYSVQTDLIQECPTHGSGQAIVLKCFPIRQKLRYYPLQ